MGLERVTTLVKIIEATSIPDWNAYDAVICGISGGKDSQATATWLIQDSGCPGEKIRLTFNNTGNEHDLTYEHIRYIEQSLNHQIEWLKPDLDFYHLAEKKKRFPAAKSRFCTTWLKMQPSQRYTLELQRAGLRVLLVTGVRRAESLARSTLPEFGFDDYYAAPVYRPLIDWTTERVFRYLKDKDQHPNPLYAFGAQRVGCFPCIMSRKHEIRMIADRFPERIDLIREWEGKIGGGWSIILSANIHPGTFQAKSLYQKRRNLDVRLD